MKYLRLETKESIRVGIRKSRVENKEKRKLEKNKARH